MHEGLINHAGGQIYRPLGPSINRAKINQVRRDFRDRPREQDLSAARNVDGRFTGVARTILENMIETDVSS